MHTIGGLVIMAVTSAIVHLLKVNDALLTGAISASMFYYSREVNQFQTELANRRKVYRSSLWYRGWWIWEWEWKRRLEFLCPVIACFLTWVLFWAVF